MDNNSNNHHLPPVIYVAEYPEQAINYKWYSKLNKNVTVLEACQIQKLGEGKKHFYLPYDLLPGEVLVRHPYNQGYILATEAENEYLKASTEGIFLIARCLGATKIVYKKCNIAEFKREINSNGDITYEAIKTKLEVKDLLEQKLESNSFKKQEYSKQEFTIEQFNKAKSVAEERGLIMSRDIRSLLDARNPELGSLLTHQTVNVEISSSLNQVMDIVFSLDTASVFSLNSNTKIATSKKTELNIEWDIVF